MPYNVTSLDHSVILTTKLQKCLHGLRSPVQYFMNAGGGMVANFLALYMPLTTTHFLITFKSAEYIYI